MKTLKQAFPEMYESGRLLFDEPLAPYSSFQIGGPADALAKPKSQRELIDLLLWALNSNTPWFILGKGTNLLISDKGMRGLIIGMENYHKLTRDENFISAFAGVTLKELCDFAQEQGLAGLEFACGIPGSVGGAVFMNAGAYGGEIKDVLYCSKCLKPEIDSLTSSNPIIHFRKEQHEFRYRNSALQSLGLIHLSSVFELKYDEPEAILKRMQDLHDQRNDKQPMDMPSAGSTFKRPEGYFAGKLVDDCGLRGYRIGDAAVSDKHCGFIVNHGNATAAEVLELIRYVQNTVKERYGVMLETEIRIVGEM